MSAVLSLLHTGDHIICALDVYGGTYQLVKMLSEDKHCEVDFFDGKRLDLAEKLLKPNTKVAFFIFKMGNYNLLLFL
jgi:O-acetylhomoserine (thiol)-lyase